MPFEHIEEINESIDNLLENILESEIQEELQTPLLAGLAIGKKSLYYWNNQFADNNSYWSQINNRQTTQAISSRMEWPTINWGAVVKADVKGMISGFVKGLFSGGGALAGAGTGAIAGSAIELGSQIYDFYFGEE